MNRMSRARSIAALLVSAATLPPCHSAVAQQAPVSHLETRWAKDVTPANAWPEYPRPQMVRHDWQNLNGLWDYAITDSGAATPTAFDGKILVPFPVESQLSGVRRAVTPAQRLWYHRTFTVPHAWRSGRVLLHFGAVDWDATVFVNGREVGEHKGGYDPFTFDVTDALTSGARQQVVVSVWDPTDQGGQPRGKQVLHPHSIWYTAVTGIWQTVWLEPVPSSYISSLLITPNLDANSVTVIAHVPPGPESRVVHVTALDGARAVATGNGMAENPITLKIPDPQLWSPSHPFLYHLRIALASGDSVTSYFGMRKIALGRDAHGVIRLFLNNEPLFEFGTLDQGWWPDGLYTPPSQAAMLNDLLTLKRLHFNMTRKHVKEEPARWYYGCDSLGLLVWQDMPSGDNTTDSDKAEFSRELAHMVDALRNHPSIVMWVPFNEGWGQHDTPKVVAWIKAHDPTRLVDDASGWTDKGVGDVIDLHDYPGPGIPKLDSVRARVLGEFGGLGFPIRGHTWVDSNNWGYRRYSTQEQLADAYGDLIDQLRILKGEGLAAAVYTQTTDVEVEVNGLMTYDRALVKLPPRAIALNATVYGPPPVVKMVVPTSADTPQVWRYTTAKPAGRWYAANYADGSWQRGPGGFGTAETPGAHVGTVWDTPDIWIRRTFTLTDAHIAHPHLVIHHDEDAEVYLNGVLIGKYPGYTTAYTYLPLGAVGTKQLRRGTNTIAVHVHQTKGGQYIDVGLADVHDTTDR